MIPLKSFTDILTSLEIVEIKIYDRNDNFLYELKGISGKDLAKKFEDLTFLKFYGSVEVKGANKAIIKSNWRGAMNWKVQTDMGENKNTLQIQAPQPVSMVSQMKDMLDMMMMFKTMSGMNGNGEGMLETKLELYKAQSGLEMEKFKLMNDDPIKKYGALMPIALSFMGKKPEDIRSLMQMTAMSNIQGVPESAEGKKDMVLSTFEDLKKMKNKDKNKMIEDLLAQLNEVISAEHFIMLLEMVIQKPERAQKAIQASQMGMI